MAAEWIGWNNIFQVEKDEWCRKVLAKNFPKTERFADIKDFTGNEYTNRIDVISGGFPCQPFSVAGQRKGKNDDRYLWEEMLRVIATIKPTYVVGENVTGIIGLALDTVLSDLEAQNYTTETFIIPACSKNAWHRRDRVWITAYKNTNRFRCNSSNGQNKSDFGQFGEFGTGNNERLHREAIYANTEGSRWDSEAQQELDEEKNGRKQGCGLDNLCNDVTYTNNTGCKKQREQFTDGTKFFAPKCDSWWEAEPGVGRVAARLPNRVDRLKGLGNAIVPQVAFEIFTAIDFVLREGKKLLIR